MIFLLLTLAYGWNDKIHGLIMQLATKNLTETAKEDLRYRSEFLNLNTKNGYKDLAVAMDHWRKHFHFPLFNGLHYNKEKINSFQEYKHMENSGILLTLFSSIKCLLLQKRSFILDTMSLVFLTHLMGDLHQPFHIGPCSGKQYGKGELAGKKYQDLHSFWDSGCQIYDRINEEEAVKDILEFGRKNIVEVSSFSYEKDRLETDPVTYLGEFLTPIFEETYEFSKDKAEKESKIVYGEKYISECHIHVKKQIYRAGTRLGYVLEILYKNNIFPVVRTGNVKKGDNTILIIVIILNNFFFIMVFLFFYLRRKIK